MLLTQLFYIGSNIFPPHTHAPLANPAQSNPCSGNHLFFFFFSWDSETSRQQHSAGTLQLCQGKTGAYLLFLPYILLCMKCCTNTQLMTAVMSKSCQLKRTEHKNTGREQVSTLLLSFWTQQCPHLSAPQFPVSKSTRDAQPSSRGVDLRFFW